MSHPRTGYGTIISITQDPWGSMLIKFLRDNGTEDACVVEPEVATAFSIRYGIQDPMKKNVRHLKPIYGSRFRFDQTSQGLLTKVEILPN